MTIDAVFNLTRWFRDNEHLLIPPVNNKIIYEDPELIVMAIGGPNSRKDYHFHERGPEFFYQVKGDMILKIMGEEGPRDTEILEGEIYLMPGGTIHSPQRFVNTWGIVLEKKALHGEKDFLQWYCENCNTQLHEEKFDLTNIVTELPPLFEKFYSSEELRTCTTCEYVMEPPN